MSNEQVNAPVELDISKADTITCEECGKSFTFQQSYHKHLFYHNKNIFHIL